MFSGTMSRVPDKPFALMRHGVGYEERVLRAAEAPALYARVRPLKSDVGATL